MGSFGEYFLFYGLTEFIYALKALSSSSCPRLIPLSLPGVWREIRPHPFTMTSVPKLIFLFPISADGRRGLFPLWDSSQSFGFYLLPSPVRRFVRATICPCTSFFTHPVTEYKHLLVSILTWICYLSNWPRFLFQRSVFGLLIQIRRNSSNPFFSSLSGRPRDKYFIGISLPLCPNKRDDLLGLLQKQGYQITIAGLILTITF